MALIGVGVAVLALVALLVVIRIAGAGDDLPEPNHASQAVQEPGSQEPVDRAPDPKDQPSKVEGEGVTKPTTLPESVGQGGPVGPQRATVKLTSNQPAAVMGRTYRSLTVRLAVEGRRTTVVVLGPLQGQAERVGLRPAGGQKLLTLVQDSRSGGGWTTDNPAASGDQVQVAVAGVLFKGTVPQGPAAADGLADQAGTGSGDIDE